MKSRIIQVVFFAAFLLVNAMVQAQTPLVTPDGRVLMGGGGTFIMAAPGVPVGPNDAPVADPVTITYSPALGQPVVGRTLSASYTYTDTENDPQGTATYQWYWASDPIFGTPEAIVGATTSSYLLTSTDFGRYIKVGVTPVATAGTSPGVEAVSNYVGAVAAASSCPATLTVAHTVDGVSPIAGSITYGVVESSLSGAAKCWITQNLGATTQAASATDDTAASAGWYWQFNSKQGYNHDGTTRTPNTAWITSISESSDWLPANDPCTLLLGAGWRIPTNIEWTAADGTGGGNWANLTNTFDSALKIHAAGNLNTSGALGSRGSFGLYWSSTQANATGGRYLFLSSGSSAMGGSDKAYGFSVRCLKD